MQCLVISHYHFPNWSWMSPATENLCIGYSQWLHHKPPSYYISTDPGFFLPAIRYLSLGYPIWLHHKPFKIWSWMASSSDHGSVQIQNNSYPWVTFNQIANIHTINPWVSFNLITLNMANTRSLSTQLSNNSKQIIQLNNKYKYYWASSSFGYPAIAFSESFYVFNCKTVTGPFPLGHSCHHDTHHYT